MKSYYILFENGHEIEFDSFYHIDDLPVMRTDNDVRLIAFEDVNKVINPEFVKSLKVNGITYDISLKIKASHN